MQHHCPQHRDRQCRPRLQRCCCDRIRHLRWSLRCRRQGDRPNVLPQPICCSHLPQPRGCFVDILQLQPELPGNNRLCNSRHYVCAPQLRCWQECNIRLRWSWLHCRQLRHSRQSEVQGTEPCHQPHAPYQPQSLRCRLPHRVRS